MSEAFASTLRLSFEVRGGLLMRQIHHWAALIFMAAIVTHMMRVFFTGAFRKPREVNWVVGFTLLILGLAAGFSGYSLPDDVLSGNGLRITDGVVRAIPIIGSYTSYFMFGGEFPGQDLIPRLFTVHILLVPGLILALIGLHLFFVVLHKHTQYPGSGRIEQERRRLPALPDLRGEGRRLLLHGVRRHRADGGDDDDQPGVELRAVRPLARLGGRATRLVHAVPRGMRCASCPGFTEVVIGQYTLSLQRDHPGDGRARASCSRCSRSYPFVEAAVTGDRERAPRARPAAQPAVPHGVRRLAPDGVLHPRARRLERPHRDALPPVDQRHHVGVPGR